ncbi:hypothetical protein PUN28_016503 [Cardiocondyla obscurior]|uniref:Uncharacterized protein n=1 Tax=Cardiocondyla obscurior TaxID=286306 RepID=A0AAW2EP24_9HYME
MESCTIGRLNGLSFPPNLSCPDSFFRNSLYLSVRVYIYFIINYIYQHQWFVSVLSWLPLRFSFPQIHTPERYGWSSTVVVPPSVLDDRCSATHLRARFV